MPTPPATGPSDPNSSCRYCRAHSVGTPLADELVCNCDTPCAASRCSAREEWQDCAGRCGKPVPKNRTACMDCWELLPPDLREAITARRGALRDALILEARGWYEKNVSYGQLINPAPGPKVRITLAERGASMPTPARAHTDTADQPDRSTAANLPSDRVEVTRVVFRGGDADPHDPGSPLQWHRLSAPGDTTVLVLTRPRTQLEGEIALNFDGNRVTESTRGGVYGYLGARTLAEAQLAHYAWSTWRHADQESRKKGSPVTVEEANRLRGLYEKVIGGLTAHTDETAATRT